MSDEVQITVRVNNQTGPGITSVNQTINRLSRTAREGNGAFGDLRATLLSLAPAAVPVAASLAPIAVRAGAAGLAVAAFGAALVPQIGNLSDAAKAQDKYTQAVTKYGAGSKQAVQAQQFIADTLSGMPAATQRAAAAYSNLRDEFKGFSDSTARFTMQPVEHSFAVLGALLPKLTPMVQSTSGQLDRLVKVAGGAINTSGFDALSKKVSDFANRSLTQAVSGSIHLMRVLSEGKANGPITEFMAYAKQQGPAVRELLSNLMLALGNIAKGAAQAGPGMLSIVNALAKMAAAVPPELIGSLMQVYTAFKLIKLAGAGVAAVGGGIQSLAAKITALRAASTAAGGGLAGLRAAFLALGTATKATIVVAGIAAVVAVLSKLSNIGKSAPPDVDKLTTALTKLGDTGKVTGEAASKFGAHFEKLKSQIDKVLDPSVAESINNWGSKVTGGLLKPGDATEEFTKSVDAIDTSLANLVHGGKAGLAKTALADMIKGMRPEQVSKFKGKLDDYKSALADAALEQKLTAESMGLFGDAAAKTSAKLADQKASADGLRQSIQALNDVNRQGLGGMIGFEAAIDAAAKAAKENHGALSMTNGVLNLNSERARNAASALQDLADKTDTAGSAQREAGASWETVNGIYSRGRSQLIKQAEAMGLTKDQAKALASQLLKIPTDTVPKVRLDDEDAKAGIQAFNAALKKTPGAHQVTLKTLSSSAEQVLEAFGFKVKHLPNGSVRVTAATGGALSGIRNVAGAIASLHDKTVSITSIHNVITNSKTYRSVHDITGATGGLFTGKSFRYADGGLVQGPGTGTSDDVPAPWLSNGEFVIKKAAVDKYGERFLQRINDGQFDGPHYAKGGKVTKAQKAAKAQAKAESQARHDASGLLSLSHFGWMAGWRKDEFQNALGKPDSLSSLVSALNQWRGIIQKATHGSTETKLLKQLDQAGKQLLKWEKQLNSVTANLSKAKDKLASLKDAAASLASSVKGGLLSSTNITRGAGDGGPVTLSSIRAGMRISKDKVTAFASALKQLKAKGFSKSIIQQVAEAGIDGGGLETAGALLGASASEVKTINQTQSQIEAAAGSAGKTAADAVYGKAIKQQERYVKSLEAQQKKLTTSMDRLAKTMEDSIKKAFGKKAAGGIVGAAASGGLRSSLTWVGEQGPELLDLPAGSRVWSNPDSRRKLAQGQAPWSSMLNSPRRASAAGASGGVASSQPQVVVLEIRAGDSGRYTEFLVAELRRAVQVRGSIEATLKPSRGR